MLGELFLESNQQFVEEAAAHASMNKYEEQTTVSGEAAPEG